MNFMKALENEMNVSYTENGMKGYKTTNNELVDFNFALAGFRSLEDEDLVLRVKKLFADKNLSVDTLLRYMFFIRDVREGMGERKVFRVMFKELALNYPYIAKAFIPYVAEYGRWDDLFILAETSLKVAMFAYLDKQLKEDWKHMKAGEPISLLAKWMPSVNSGKKSRKLALSYINILDYRASEYRKQLKEMRKYLDIVEQHITNSDYETIKYESVPSNANKRYANLFLHRDYERRKEYLDSLSKGEVKINASVLYPHEVIGMVRKYLHTPNRQLCDGLWKNLKDYEGAENTLVVADVSGSMYWDGGKILPIDCSVGLGMYFAQRAKSEAFKGKIMTFSSIPKLVDVSAFKDICDAYQWMVNDMPWAGSTNIQAVFELVLKTAVTNKLKQEEIPNILIISDMEFDYCTEGRRYDFEAIKEKYAYYGYKLPKLIFWNVASRTNTIPCTTNDLGVVLLSGYSPAAIKAAVGGAFDPLQALYDCLYVKRYDFVSKVLLEVVENASVKKL